MQVASYLMDGAETFGLVRDGGLVAFGGQRGGRFATLRQALAAGALDQLADAAGTRGPDVGIDDVTFVPLIPEPAKIICVGFNYKAHADEAHHDLPEFPTIFTRLTNTLLGHGAAMIRPKVSTSFDFEGELAVIIGRAGRHIAREDALGHVAGYTCFIDGSVRDYQKHSVTAGKNFIGTGPLGPWMTTADEIPDPSALTLITRLNGQEMQRTGTDLMVYSIPDIIAYVSAFTPLEPGDVIATGTPAGVGHRRKPQLWMKAGDIIEVEISGIGTLRNSILDE